MNLKIIETRKFTIQGSEFQPENWKGFEYGYYIVERKEAELESRIMFFYGFDPDFKSEEPFMMAIPLIDSCIENEIKQTVEPKEHDFTVSEMLKAISMAQELKTELDKLNKSK